MKFANTLLLILSLALSACATNPVTGKSDFALVSENEEIKQGRSYHNQIIASYGVYEVPALQQYVNSIGQDLATRSHRAHLEFTFTLLDSPEINAFALPGGYVYITRGIMAYLDSRAELAGVLGHEIGHVTARHSVRQQSGQMASTLLGTSAEDQFAGTEKILLDINQSFRRLSQAQIDAIEVPRLQIVKRKFNSFETLAEQSAIEYEAVNILRLLNRAYPSGDITKINNLKTVTFND